jgi:C4-dicarboxylate transporter DctM subunit
MLRLSRSDRAQLVPNLLFSFSSTATTTVMILFIIIEVGIFSYFLTLVQIPQIVAKAIVELPAAACLCPSRHCSISRPTCFSMPSPCWPSSCRSSSRPYRSGLRSDLVQHSVCENARNRIDAPAVGLNCLVIAGIDRDTSLSDVFRGAQWFVVMEMFTIGLIFFFPMIVTWLPDTMMGRGSLHKRNPPDSRSKPGGLCIRSLYVFKRRG